MRITTFPSTGSSLEPSPNTRAIGSTLLRPCADNRPCRYANECSRASTRPKRGAKRPCNPTNSSAAARSSSVVMGIALLTKTKRQRTGQFKNVYSVCTKQLNEGIGNYRCRADYRLPIRLPITGNRHFLVPRQVPSPNDNTKRLVDPP